MSNVMSSKEPEPRGEAACDSASRFCTSMRPVLTSSRVVGLDWSGTTRVLTRSTVPSALICCTCQEVSVSR